MRSRFIAEHTMKKNCGLLPFFKSLTPLQNYIFLNNRFELFLYVIYSRYIGMHYAESSPSNLIFIHLLHLLQFKDYADDLFRLLLIPHSLWSTRLSSSFQPTLKGLLLHSLFCHPFQIFKTILSAFSYSLFH
jgi:hypothetical protein